MRSPAPLAIAPYPALGRSVSETVPCLPRQCDIIRCRLPLIGSGDRLACSSPSAADGAGPNAVRARRSGRDDSRRLVDPRCQSINRVSGVSGSIKSVGSDTMNNLMTLWSEGFKRYYPNVRAEIEGKGSSTAPPALIAGTATFGPMSRDMKSSEIDAFDAKYGYKPITPAGGHRHAGRVRAPRQPDLSG